MHSGDRDLPSDDALALLAAAGDRSAFELLVVRYGSHLLAVIARQVGDPDRADDLAQDVWLKAFRALPRWRPGGSFRSWLFSIALNHVRDALRTSRRSKVVYLDDFRGDAGGSGPDSHARDAERALIEQALAVVKEPFRTAVVLVDVMQLSYDEAASSLACRVGTVKSRVNRGRLAFRDEYCRLSPAPDHESPDRESPDRRPKDGSHELRSG